MALTSNTFVPTVAGTVGARHTLATPDTYTAQFKRLRGPMEVAIAPSLTSCEGSGGDSGRYVRTMIQGAQMIEPLVV